MGRPKSEQFNSFEAMLDRMLNAKDDGHTQMFASVPVDADQKKEERGDSPLSQEDADEFNSKWADMLKHQDAGEAIKLLEQMGERAADDTDGFHSMEKTEVAALAYSWFLKFGPVFALVMGGDTQSIVFQTMFIYLMGQQNGLRLAKAKESKE